MRNGGFHPIRRRGLPRAVWAQRVPASYRAVLRLTLGPSQGTIGHRRGLGGDDTHSEPRQRPTTARSG
jgi:hypothetical protein